MLWTFVRALCCIVTTVFFALKTECLTEIWRERKTMQKRKHKYIPIAHICIEVIVRFAYTNMTTESFMDDCSISFDAIKETKLRADHTITKHFGSSVQTDICVNVVHVKQHTYLGIIRAHAIPASCPWGQLNSVIAITRSCSNIFLSLIALTFCR